jgi:3-deoxy-7-phosphoheptulonate synthase
MLLRLRTGLAGLDYDAILGIAKELGYEARFLDEARVLLQLSGRGRPGDRARFEDNAAVAQVLDASDVPELHERRGRPDTLVRVGAASFGRGCASLIAGPCAVESRERLFEIATAVRSAGATLLRGGAFKPRTSPHSFQGLGSDGLELLVEARARTGLGIVTEVLDPRDVERVARATDMFQIGSRSMGYAPLLQEVARAGKPVLLKRGMASSAREFLLAAEYVLATGNEQVVLCERGIRGFDRTTRNVLDVGAVAWLKQATHLPVIVDPSHAAGRADLVPALARAGIAAGADGLIVEVHPRPCEARSDGAQAVGFAEIAKIAADTRAILALDGRKLCSLDAPGDSASPRDAASANDPKRGTRKEHTCDAR